MHRSLIDTGGKAGGGGGGGGLATTSEFFRLFPRFPSFVPGQIISVKREQIDLKKINIFQREYSKFLSESFRDEVSIQNWNYSHDNVNDSFKYFYTKLEASVDRHAPLKKLTPREIKIRSKPWLSPEILKMIKIRYKIFARKEATQKC